MVICAAPGTQALAGPRLVSVAPRPLSPVSAVSAPERSVAAARRLREQAIRYEVLANDGRYASRTRRTAFPDAATLRPEPLYFAEVELTDPQQAHLFHAAGDEVGRRLEDELIERDRDTPDGRFHGVAHLPVHWEERETLHRQFPSLQFVKDGRVYRGSSPRSLFFGTDPKDIPKSHPDLEPFCLKMHLSDASYARMVGLVGHRDINANDAMIATVMSHLAGELAPRLSRFFAYQPESRAMAVRIGEGPAATEVGMIFRELPAEPLIPGFALYSPTKEPLPQAPLKAVDLRACTGEPPKTTVLAAEAIELAMRKDPDLDKVEAFIQLFVDPVYDVVFSLAREGLAVELHPQNFLLSFDPKTGLPVHLVIRDLHGMACDDAWRQEHGLEPLLTEEHLRGAFPDLTRDDLDRYLMRDGKIRDRYVAPLMFEKMIDFFSAIFFYQLLSALHDHGYLTKPEVNVLVESIRDRLEHFAKKHEFDLSSLSAPSPSRTSFWDAKEHNVRGKALFRRWTTWSEDSASAA